MNPSQAQQIAESPGLPASAAGHSVPSAVAPAGEPSLWTRLGPARWLGILWATAPAIFGFTLIASLGPVSEWLLAHREAGLTIYIALFALSAGFGLLPTYAQTILGSWVFGLWLGFGAAMLAFTLASIIGYTVARTVSRDRIERIVESNPQALAVRQALIGRGMWKTLGIVALIRLPTNSPFALTNLAMASVGVRILPFVAGTAVGMAPRTCLAAYLAASMQATGARDIQTFASERGWWLVVVGLVGMLVVLAIISAIARRALRHVTCRADSTAS